MKELLIKITDSYYEKAVNYDLDAPTEIVEAIRHGTETTSEDCISRESVELALTGKDLPEDRNKYIALINKRIRELPSVLPKAKWIPVSESLPDESHNSVLGWDAYRERCVFVQYWDGHFQITGKTESFDIKAWMPLPEPYREVEE